MKADPGTAAAFRADCCRMQHATQVSAAQVVRLILASPGTKAMLGYRLGRHLVSLRAAGRLALLRPLGWATYWAITGYVKAAYDIRLDLSADIGPGLYIGHFGNIVVRNCRIGSHCSIHQSVHIEPAGTGQGPTVGDRVWIGPHARVVGAYHIGDRSTVSAGAVVAKDIPSRALFMGNPGRVAMSEYDNSSIL